MLGFKIKRKLDFYVSVSIFVFILVSMTTKYAGIGFPKEDSLFYTTGILSLHDNVGNSRHV